MDMGGMDMTGWRMVSTGLEMGMVPTLAPWTLWQFGLMFVMWAIMMVGMMTPSVAPTVLVYARVGRQAAATGRPLASTGSFLAGYVLAWIAFAFVATTTQWLLESAALLTSEMTLISDIAGGVVLLAIGLYQWTPLKDACLRQCQSPLLFIHRHGGFRRDALGSIGLGLRHGLYCVGCCWTLMALLFIGGVMNVLWIAALAAFVLIEKILPGGRLVSHLAGIAAVVAGIGLIASHFV
jgi:predicted metal-binding membrane protein